MSWAKLSSAVLLILLGLSIVAAGAAASNPIILPVPSIKELLTFTSESKHAISMTSSVGTVECSGLTSKGSFFTSDGGEGTLVLTGCKGKTPFFKLVVSQKCNTEGSASGTISLPYEIWLVTYLVSKELSLGVLRHLPISTIVHCEKFNLEFSGALMGQATGVKATSGEFNFRVNKEGKQELKECDLLEAICLSGGTHKKFELFARFLEGEEFHEFATSMLEEKVTFGKNIEVVF